MQMFCFSCTILYLSNTYVEIIFTICYDDWPLVIMIAKFIIPNKCHLLKGLILNFDTYKVSNILDI